MSFCTAVRNTAIRDDWPEANPATPGDWPQASAKHWCDLLRDDWVSFVAAVGYLFLLLHSATENSAQLRFSLTSFFQPNHFATRAAPQPDLNFSKNVFDTAAVRLHRDTHVVCILVAQDERPLVPRTAAIAADALCNIFRDVMTEFESN